MSARRIFSTGGVAGIAAILLGATIAQAGLASTNASRVGSGLQGIEGAWLATIDVEGQPTRPGMHAYLSDGVLITTPSARTNSNGMGEWVRMGDRQFAETFMVFRFDETGTFVGYTKVQSTITLNAAGDAWSDPNATAQIYDSDWNLLRTVKTPHEGTRIRQVGM